jgi:hypothetical protein
MLGKNQKFQILILKQKVLAALKGLLVNHPTKSYLSA